MGQDVGQPLTTLRAAEPVPDVRRAAGEQQPTMKGNGGARPSPAPLSAAQRGAQDPQDPQGGSGPPGAAAQRPQALQGQRVLDEAPHGGGDGAAQRVGDLVGDLVQVGLHVLQAGVEDVVHLGLRGHFGQVFVAVHHLHNVDDLLAQLLAHLLAADLPLLLVGQVHHVHLDGPQLPGDAFVREGPAGFLLLVELQGDLPHAVAAGAAQRVLRAARSQGPTQQ